MLYECHLQGDCKTVLDRNDILERLQPNSPPEGYNDHLFAVAAWLAWRALYWGARIRRDAADHPLPSAYEACAACPRYIRNEQDA